MHLNIYQVPKLTFIKVNSFVWDKQKNVRINICITLVAKEARPFLLPWHPNAVIKILKDERG